MKEHHDGNRKTHFRLYELVFGERLYLMEDCEDMDNDRQAAAIFPAEAWDNWASEVEGLRPEWLPEDELLRMEGAPTLPGFEELAITN